MKFSTLMLAPALALGFAATAVQADTAQQSIDRGRHLITITGCNECHTQGYTAVNGAMQESAWLAGSKIGYRGPWGTSYAQNLRLHFADLTEAQWLDQARTDDMDPPMPFWELRAMSDQELKDIYAYVRSLGPTGEALPDTVPFGTEPTGQYLLMVPMGQPAN
jgi:mono/diheme cytochrome c family protein